MSAPKRSGTLIAGLTSTEAVARLKQYGPNVLPEAKRPSRVRKLIAQMTHFFAILLWVAGALALIAGMPQLGIAIFAVIVINGAFAYVQEARAERATERLRDLLPRSARVVRDGQTVEIDAAELVVGDVVALEGGDRVSADLSILEARSLSVDTSMLTGESVPIQAEVGTVVGAGAFVSEGTAFAQVIATGGATRLATIARLTQDEPRRATPLAIELNRVVRIIALIAVGVGVGFFGLAVLIGTPATDGFLFAIGVTVALVPEGLLPTVTLALAVGAQRMAKRHALVRRLESVETLGSTTCICTDKTGTLTRNEMTVMRAWTPAGEARATTPGYAPTGAMDIDAAARDAIVALASAARGCSTGSVVEDAGRWIAVGDPMEAAIDTFARRLEAPIPNDDEVRVRFPFDPRRRRTSAVISWHSQSAPGDTTELVTKGAPEELLTLCISVSDDAQHVIDDFATSGLRVIAVARKPMPTLTTLEVEHLHGTDANELETNLELLGLLGFEDPPRTGTLEAIAACRIAGIQIVMLTGDHPTTAAAIATQIGLRHEGDRIVDGSALPDDNAALGELIDADGVVVSRVNPEDKLRILQALQQRGHVVAMTGDGVNDGPALHAADIGVAMGLGGTDVAREAADLVLLDDEFYTIVAAVDQGRATFANIRRFLTYHLTDNVAELTPFVLWALSAGRFPLAIGVLQVLALDIGTDLLPALALGAEPAHAERDLVSLHVNVGPPGRRRLFDRTVLRRAFLVIGPTEAFFEIAAFLASLWGSGWRPGDSFPTGVALATASGAAFAAVVIGQFANAYACRSTTQSPWHLGWNSNPLLAPALAAELVIVSALLYVGPIAHVLGQRAPSTAGFVVAALAAPGVLAADTLDKRRRRRRAAVVS